MKRPTGDIFVLLTLTWAVTLLISCVAINPKPQNTEIIQDKPIKAEQDPATQSAEHVIVVIEEWPPYTSASMEGYGLVSQIVTEAMEAGGVDFEFQFKPWARALEAVKYGDAWGTFPWRFTEERRKDYFCSDSLMLDKSMLFYYKGNPVMKKPFPKYEELKDLKDYYKFGGVFGYYYEDVFKKGGYNNDLSTTVETSFMALKNGRVDLVNEGEAVGWHIISKLYPDEKDNFDTLPDPIDINNMYMLVTKKNKNTQEILDQFNSGMKKIKENGVYDEIMNDDLNIN